MADSGLFGPHPLSAAVLDLTLHGVAPGTYALGDTNAEGAFVIRYVGRSDSDLRARLHDWVGKYPKFKYGFFKTAKDAFLRECRVFHDFGETASLDNEIHPARAQGSDWKCPHCGR